MDGCGKIERRERKKALPHQFLKIGLVLVVRVTPALYIRTAGESSVSMPRVHRNAEDSI